MLTSRRDVDEPLSHNKLRLQILAELNQIVDPCSRATALPAGLVDMGLVRALHIEPQNDGRMLVRISLCVTHPFCMMPAIFIHEVEKRLKVMPEIAFSDVSLDVTTLWTEELMSSEYRDKLEAQRSEKKLSSDWTGR